MARLILANATPSEDRSNIAISHEFANKVVDMLVNILKEHGAYHCTSGASKDQFRGDRHVHLEFPSKGGAIVEVNYGFWSQAGGVHKDYTDMLCSSTLFMGHEGLYGIGSEVVKRIKDCYAAHGVKVHSDKVFNQDGIIRSFITEENLEQTVERRSPSRNACYPH